MKLLRKDMSLKEFHGNHFQYAILSHTWGEKEFTYEELRRLEKMVDRTPEASPGYRKIVSFTTTASLDGFELFWADTCCIDQRNSSELYEAINSMFSWYRNAGVCYVYLEDFEWDSDEIKTLKQDKNKSNDVRLRPFVLFNSQLSGLTFNSGLPGSDNVDGFFGPGRSKSFWHRIDWSFSIETGSDSAL